MKWPRSASVAEGRQPAYSGENAVMKGNREGLEDGTCPPSPVRVR
ncbi:protein of unknown function [Azospirillum lipoferum 4B]|uniref:Uncharacterized protein n=1 Tax=Azospirillum lipoferum (strain 4B) TaxID=862719 RepID=G7Z1W0_AZOL4|nr:protein of unknown function [Azospirillum lipoferum 4B]